MSVAATRAREVARKAGDASWLAFVVYARPDAVLVYTLRLNLLTPNERSVMARKALCVGINEFASLPRSSWLSGCVNDAEDMAKALKKHGFTVAGSP